ncbi:MAG TPA: hypothetical protein VLF63_03605, partial [Patescibacteria group bacterium]|nr:hypothetical protein [Patescibacteria group bacterium]
MATNHPSKYIRDPNLRNKFNIIIILIILVLIIGFINFWFSMKIMSSVRAYVGGEGLWSKSEKGAVISLIKYSDSQNPRDYNQYSKYIKVPLGDHLARTELNKEEPDYKVVRKGFIQGEINPSDVNNLIFLYKYFKHEHYMSKAI